MQGLSGNDTLIGGAGNDTLTGGADNDRFEFAAGFGIDRITDFQGGAGSGDVIRLVGLGAAFDSFAEIMAATAQSGSNAIIRFGADADHPLGFKRPPSLRTISCSADARAPPLDTNAPPDPASAR